MLKNKKAWIVVIMLVAMLAFAACKSSAAEAESSNAGNVAESSQTESINESQSESVNESQSEAANGNSSGETSSAVASEQNEEASASSDNATGQTQGSESATGAQGSNNQGSQNNGSQSGNSQGSQNNGSQSNNSQGSQNNGSQSNNSQGSQNNGSQSNNSQGNQNNGSQSNNSQGNQNTPAGQPANPSGSTPYERHGALSVSGNKIVDANGEAYQLCGVSTHGLAWFPDYVNKDAFTSIRDDWGANVIRLAMYTAEYGGYCEGGNKDNLKALVKNGVNYATELGMYVIVDWHILHDMDPNKYKSDAIAFFDEMSREYAGQDNIIYEICNEPNGGTSWSQVKSYALEVIPVIRANDPNALIIVGTPNWCQYVDDAAKDPITEYNNIVYAVHFYADTHKDDIRNRMTTALDKGLPVIISEFSICDASGNGHNNIDQANIWMNLLDQYDVGFVAWNLSNKAESSSLISSGNGKKSGWTYNELSESGRWLVSVLNAHSENGANLSGGAAPVPGSGQSQPSSGGNQSNNNQNAGNNQQAPLPSGSGNGNNLNVTVNATNTWNTGNSQFTQFSININNPGASSVNGWTIEIDLGQTAAIDQIWCATGRTEGNKVIITPESYNANVESGKTISDIGLIVSTPGAVASTNVTVR